MKHPIDHLKLKTQDVREQRRHRRNACFLRGEILTGEGQAGIPCEVHDISTIGMKLVVENVSLVPDRVKVRVRKRQFEAWVDVVRRGSADIGVQFINERL